MIFFKSARSDVKVRHAELVKSARNPPEIESVLGFLSPIEGSFLCLLVRILPHLSNGPSKEYINGPGVLFSHLRICCNKIFL
jgi:hypothetical protein